MLPKEVIILLTIIKVYFATLPFERCWGDFVQSFHKDYCSSWDQHGWHQPRTVLKRAACGKKEFRIKSVPLALREKWIWQRSEVIFLIWFAATPVALAWQGHPLWRQPGHDPAKWESAPGQEGGMGCRTGLMIPAGTTLPAPLLQQERHEQTHRVSWETVKGFIDTRPRRVH